MLLAGVGGFFGSCARYLVGRLTAGWAVTPFPIGTFAVNIIGCLLIGLFTGIAASGHLPAQWKLVLVTGYCGGFTTFSTFMNENYLLGKDNLMMLAIYTVASLALGMGALVVGYKIASAF